MASLTSHRAQTISEAATGSSWLYLALIGASVAAFKYRDRARRWLDERFFREEYDARKILLSLASRVRFETNPADLASLVVTQIDEALHPETVAVLVSGVEEGRLTPVNVLRGSVESLPLDGGLVAMLRWSDDPLEIFSQDPRSPARRLPPEEQEWLECTNVALLVPVVSQDRALIAVIALAEKRSEDPYTTEDRQLLASIGSQMGLGFDVARLRQRADTPSHSAGSVTKTMVTAPLPQGSTDRRAAAASVDRVGLRLRHVRRWRRVSRHGARARGGSAPRAPAGRKAGAAACDSDSLRRVRGDRSGTP